MPNLIFKVGFVSLLRIFSYVTCKQYVKKSIFKVPKLGASMFWLKIRLKIAMNMLNLIFIVGFVSFFAHILIYHKPHMEKHIKVPNCGPKFGHFRPEK